MSSVTSTEFHPWHFFVLCGLAAATGAVLLTRQTSPAALVLLSAGVLGAAVAGVAFHRTLAPLVDAKTARTADPNAGAGGRARAGIEREKTLVLRSIKELEFDRAMGKIAEADFREMEARLRARALGLMKRLDADRSGYVEMIEREVARRLREADASGARSAKGPVEPVEPALESVPPKCQCGVTNDTDARFCKACGARLSA